MFRLRLFYPSEVHQPDPQVTEERLKQVVSDAGEASLPELLSDPPQLSEVLAAPESETRPSWFDTFNRELIHALSFSDHEAFDHPVACLLIVSSNDEQPINKFVDLFNTDQLPSLLNEGAMDPKILKHYLLLHDNQDGSPDKATNLLAEMRSTFGSNDCRLLCINSAQGTVREWNDNPWAPFVSASQQSQDAEFFLNVDDVSEIMNLMQDLSTKHIIPHMEQKVRILNQQVSATRKGFKNQIKNLWWRKGKEDTPDVPSGPTYTFSSIESQIRVLGDYAFMLRDFELALSNYRLLSTDYKLDKAWKHYAGVQEMMGLSFFMLDQSYKDAESCMESAFNTYLKIGSSGHRNATRCGLLWAEMLKARNQYKEAGGVYFRITSEVPSLPAAVMLEQASYCYLYSVPPMLRKYGFQLVLAGNRYYACDQGKHAIRTCRRALSVYSGSNWSYINDYVYFNIGRWYAFLGMFDVSIKYMLKVLACDHQSPAMQELYMSDFLHTVQNMNQTFAIPKLQLPVIDISSVKVTFEDQRTYASSVAGNVGESLWKSLEEDMVPSTVTVRSNWLESQTKSTTVKKIKTSSVCVVGEAIKVYIKFKNPLQISIFVSGASLMCEHSASLPQMDTEESLSISGYQKDEELKKLASDRVQSDGVSSFTLANAEFVLRGGESTVVQLQVIPKVEGMLKIVGVRWTLSGSIIGYHSFNSNQMKNRKGRRNVKHSSNILNFIVIKGLPKLEGYIRKMPNITYSGDLRRLILELRNQSEYSVKNIKMKISHPRFLMPGTLEDMNIDLPNHLERKSIPQCTDDVQHVGEKSNNSFLFPNNITIKDGTTFSWPLWLHTGVSGKFSLYMSIYYEVENLSSDMSYRTLRMVYDLEVLPSLDVSVQITPCPSRLQEFLVRMDIANMTPSKSFWLHQLSSVGYRWEISSLLPSVSVCPSQVLLAGQAVSCIFNLKESEKWPSCENNFIMSRPFQGTDVRLSYEKDEPLLDISSSPLADFHDQERLLQGNSQGCAATVDFILISRLHGNSCAPDSEDCPLVYSHHACHCSISNDSQIRWQMDGPQTVIHDFSVSFCETRLRMKIKNCSDDTASIRISTFDVMLDTAQSTDGSLGSQAGWHDISLTTDIKTISDATSKPSASECVTSFVWSASSATRLELGPMSTVEIPLQVCVFSPGTYDLSSYELHWTPKLSGDNVSSFEKKVKGLSPGMSPGHPFYLTVLQSS
ncbi:hypothetical protein QJS10_CPA08g00028 [Acorus calamus]|uniref:Trafficking protein particle complex subunit 8 n=1 Tax=Acorus calamus TaxID=4465 RepID=A0AAV9E9H4_ACOCL|nr:hypothetical protein QJS10_CPA08g00028 [Acorus calamus]